VIRYTADDTIHDVVPADDPRKVALRERRFRRAGSYGALADDGAALISGELFVDEAKTTMVAISSSSMGITLAAATELEDGTHVLTESRPESRALWVLLGPGVLIPRDRTSLRFPAVAGAAELLEAHAAHVAGVRGTNDALPVPDASVARWIALRHEEQRRVEPRRQLQGTLAKRSFFATVGGGTALLVAARFTGHSEALLWGLLATIAAAIVVPLFTYLFLAPWSMMLRGTSDSPGSRKR